MFIVEMCSPKANQVISPLLKYTGGNGTGVKCSLYKGMFTKQGCSL